MVIASIVLVGLLICYVYLATYVIPRWIHVRENSTGRLMVNDQTVEEPYIPGVSDFHKMKRSLFNFVGDALNADP